MSDYQHLGTELCVSGSYFKTLLTLVVHTISNIKYIYARLNSTVQEQCSHTGSCNVFSPCPLVVPSGIRLLPSAYPPYVTTGMWGSKAEFRTVRIYSRVITTYQVNERSPCTCRKQGASYSDVRPNVCTIFIVTVRAGTHYPHVTWAHVMLRVQLGCERRFSTEFYDADSRFCHSAYVTWSHVELWSAHVPARLSHFCCHTHFVKREQRVEWRQRTLSPEMKTRDSHFGLHL